MTFDQWIFSHSHDQLAPSGFPYTFWVRDEVLVPGDWPGFMGCVNRKPLIAVDRLGVILFDLDVAHRMYGIYRQDSDRRSAYLAYAIQAELGRF